MAAIGNLLGGAVTLTKLFMNTFDTTAIVAHQPDRSAFWQAGSKLAQNVVGQLLLFGQPNQRTVEVSGGGRGAKLMFASQLTPAAEPACMQMPMRLRQAIRAAIHDPAG